MLQKQEFLWDPSVSVCESHPVRVGCTLLILMAALLMRLIQLVSHNQGNAKGNMQKGFVTACPLMHATPGVIDSCLNVKEAGWPVLSRWGKLMQQQQRILLETPLFLSTRGVLILLYPKTYVFARITRRAAPNSPSSWGSSSFFTSFSSHAHLGRL